MKIHENVYKIFKKMQISKFLREEDVKTGKRCEILDLRFMGSAEKGGNSLESRHQRSEIRKTSGHYWSSSQTRASVQCYKKLLLPRILSMPLQADAVLLCMSYCH